MTTTNGSHPSKPKASVEAPLPFDRQGSKDDAPFSRERLMTDLRWALMASANHIAVAGPEDSVAHTFLGFTVEDVGTFQGDVINPDAVQLERFPIAKILEEAFDFAFQVGLRAHRYKMDEVNHLRMLTFRWGSPRFVWGGTFDTPMENDESPICRTIDTADARQRLLWGDPMTVRQLALLAHMSEPAVRTSLSKEGIRTQVAHQGGNKSGATDKLGQVPYETARKWLKGRRGFVATLEPGPTDPAYVEDMIRLLKSQGFETCLNNSIYEGHSLSSLAVEAKVDPDWLLEVVTGRPAKLDIDALTRIAHSLYADVPAFVGCAVEKILRAGEPAQRSY